MNKISWVIIGLIILSISIWLLFFSKQNNQRNEESTNDNKIFTALPKKNNPYYKGFNQQLIDFNKAFNNSLGTKDILEVITDTKINQKTDNFSYDDIWIRDVAPVVTKRLVKFNYNPIYLEKKISEKLDKQFNKWLDTNQFNYHKSSLILDGGNCVWDKKESVIITDRVLTDNHFLSKEQIIEELKKDLQVTNVIIIPTEEGDILSHADGMVKFIGDNTLFISDFLGDTDFQKKVKDIIHETLPDIEIVEISSSYVEEGQYDEIIPSAKGLYINMLETENTVYVPQFNLPQDSDQLKFVQKYTNKEVIPVSINDLSTMGGAINCLTWYCPKIFLPQYN